MHYSARHSFAFKAVNTLESLFGFGFSKNLSTRLKIVRSPITDCVKGRWHPSIAASGTRKFNFRKGELGNKHNGCWIWFGRDFRVLLLL